MTAKLSSTAGRLFTASPLALACVGACAGTGALAQNPQTSDATGASDHTQIIVNGQVLQSNEINSVKTPTPIIDVPQSLSIVSAEQITQQGFDSIADIVLYTPGVTVSQGEGHRDAVVFRGVRSTADFFVDGVRDDVQYYRSLYNLEQVEILRGPNALLFGRGGTGGIVNRVTKKGAIGETFTGFQASVDTFGAYSGQVDLNLATSDSSAFRINVAGESLNNHRDFFGGERIAVNPSFAAELGPETRLDLSYEYINNDRFIDRGIPSTDAGLPARELADITFGDTDDNFTTFEAHVLRATLQHRFSDNLKGNVTASYGDYDKLYSNLFAVSFDEAAGTVGLDGYVDTTQRQSLTFAGNLIGEFATGSIGHTVLFGGEYIDTSNDNDRFNTFFDQTQDDVEFFTVARPIALSNGVGVNASGNVTVNNFSDLNDDTEADVEVLSFYVQDEIELAPWLNIVLGARFDSFDITVDNVETFIDTGTRDIRSRRDTEISPRFGVILKPQENISVYGSFSESFLPRSGEQFTDINPPDDALAPNTFQNLELGLKWNFASGLSATAAIFDLEQSSPQVSDNQDGTLDVIETSVSGVELQLRGQLTDWWHISAGYTYLDGEQANGLRPRELPENSFSLWNNLKVTERLGFGAGLTYQDDSLADNGNTVTLPSYVRFDLGAYYDVSDALRLQVNVENLFDEEYFPNAHTANNITVGAPLNARFTISGQF